MTGTHHLRALVVVAVASVIGATGCGDDTSTSSADEYRSTGNEICREADAEISAAIPDTHPTADEVQHELAPQLSQALKGVGESLGVLEPPANLADGHGRLMAEIESAAETLDAATQDEDLAAQLVEDGPPLDGMAEVATEVGLTACAGG